MKKLKERMRNLRIFTGAAILFVLAILSLTAMFLIVVPILLCAGWLASSRSPCG